MTCNEAERKSAVANASVGGTSSFSTSDVLQQTYVDRRLDLNRAGFNASGAVALVRTYFHGPSNHIQRAQSLGNGSAMTRPMRLNSCST